MFGRRIFLERHWDGERIHWSIFSIFMESKKIVVYDCPFLFLYFRIMHLSLYTRSSFSYTKSVIFVSFHYSRKRGILESDILFKHYT